MSQSTTWFLVQQLAFQFPMMLVYLAGAIAGIAFRDRAPQAAILCAIGCALMFLTSVAVTGIQAALLNQIGAGGSGMRYATMSGSIGFMGTLVRTLGMGLVVAAVFVDRTWGRGGRR